MIGRFPLNINNITYSPPAYLTAMGIDYDSNNNRIIISQFDDDKVSILNATDLTELASYTVSEPSTVKYDQTNNRFYIASDTGRLTVDDSKTLIVDGSDYSIISSHAFPATQQGVIRGFEFDYFGDRLFVSSFYKDYIQVFKLSDLSLLSTYSITQPTGMMYDSTNDKLYVARLSQKKVTVIDASTMTEEATISGTTGAVKFSEAYMIIQDNEDPDLMLLTDRVEKKIVLLSKSANAAIGEYKVTSDFPGGIVVKGNQILTTIQNLNSFAIIDKFY